MKRKTLTTDILSQDPENFNEYFSLVEQDSKDYQDAIRKTRNYWMDWPRFKKRKKC